MALKRADVIRGIVKDRNEKAHFLEKEFDKAIIGTCTKFGGDIVVAYDSTMCLKVLMTTHGCCEIEAYERFQDTIGTKEEEGSYPVFVSNFRKIKLIDFDKIDPSDSIDTLL